MNVNGLVEAYWRSNLNQTMRPRDIWHESGRDYVRRSKELDISDDSVNECRVPLTEDRFVCIEVTSKFSGEGLHECLSLPYCSVTFYVRQLFC